MTRSHLQRTAAAATLATATLLFACGGGGGSGGPITVTGTVLNGVGDPLSGANILLNDDIASLATIGVDGKFSYANVKPPYNLTVKFDSIIMEYRGLNRAALQIVFGDSGMFHRVQLGGTVTGPSYPLGNGELILLGATNGVLTDDNGGLPDGDVNPNTGAYNVWFDWAQGGIKTTDVAALLIKGTKTGITDYLMTGKLANVTLQYGVSEVDVDFGLDTPVTTHSTVLSYSLGGYTTNGTAAYSLLTANGAKFAVSNMGWNLPNGGTVKMPDGGGTLGVMGFDADGNIAIRVGTAVLGGTTVLDLPASTVLKTSLPANGAMGVSRTPPLSWTPVPGADSYVVLVSGPAQEYEFFLPGDRSTLAFPDYSALGLPLAGNTKYAWYVAALASSGISVDSVTNPAGTGWPFMIEDQASSLSQYITTEASFTTAP